MYPLIYPFIHLSIHPSTQLSILLLTSFLLAPFLFLLILPHPSTHPILLTHLSVCHPFSLIHPSISFHSLPVTNPLTSHPCMHACIHPCTHPPIHPHIHPCIHLSIHPSMHACMHPPTHPSMYPSMNPFIHVSIHPFIHPHIHPSIHPSIHASIIHPPTHPSISTDSQSTPCLAGHSEATILVNSHKLISQQAFLQQGIRYTIKHQAQCFHVVPGCSSPPQNSC